MIRFWLWSKFNLIWFTAEISLTFKYKQVFHHTVQHFSGTNQNIFYHFTVIVRLYSQHNDESTTVYSSLGWRQFIFVIQLLCEKLVNLVSCVFHLLIVCIWHVHSQVSFVFFFFFRNSRYLLTFSWERRVFFILFFLLLAFACQSFVCKFKWNRKAIGISEYKCLPKNWGQPMLKLSTNLLILLSSKDNGPYVSCSFSLRHSYCIWLLKRRGIHFLNINDYVIGSWIQWHTLRNPAQRFRTYQLVAFRILSHSWNDSDVI